MRTPNLLCILLCTASLSSFAAEPQTFAFEPIERAQALEYFEGRRYCHVEIREASSKGVPKTARELRHEPDLAVEDAQSPARTLAEVFAAQPLLAVGASSEHVRVYLDGAPADFSVVQRKRQRLDVVLTLKSSDSSSVLVLRQSKPLLGCSEAPVRTCRMGKGSMTLTSPDATDGAESSKAQTVDVDIRDLCGGLGKETMFRAPINLDGLSEWKFDTPK